MQKFTYSIGILAAMIILLSSCQKHTYDFSYAPANPKAGAKVSFINQSDAGESWVWKFGDGSQSTLKSPTHIYTKAGTYTVELMADSNKNRTITHTLQVLDSLPSIVVWSAAAGKTQSVDTVPQYEQVTLKAALYNPSKASVTYQWQVDEALFVVTKGSLTADSVVGYYTNYGRTTEVRLTITVGGKTSTDSRTLTLVDNNAPALVMQTATGELWRQRVYSDIYEAAKPYEGDPTVITLANDSTGTLNGVTYNKRTLSIQGDKQVMALQVDQLNRKVYLILEDGLFVMNANGDHLEQITSIPAFTLLLDAGQNSLYWSDTDGTWVMPLVTNPQNTISEQLLGKIKQVNAIPDVARMIMQQ